MPFALCPTRCQHIADEATHQQASSLRPDILFVEGFDDKKCNRITVGRHRLVAPDKIEGIIAMAVFMPRRELEYFLPHDDAMHGAVVEILGLPIQDEPRALPLVEVGQHEPHALAAPGWPDNEEMAIVRRAERHTVEAPQHNA